MIICSQDDKRLVDIGTDDLLFSVYSTIEMRLGLNKRKVAYAVKFIENKGCSSKDALETARQFNIVRDEFAKIPPDKAVYDLNDLKRKAPWSGRLSPVITSCANLYTTPSGKDLLFEIVSILAYCGIMKQNIEIIQE